MASRTLAPALRRLLGWQPARETKGYSGRTSSFWRHYVVPGQPYNVNWNTDRAVREGFEVNPWIYRAVHVTASKLIGWKIVLRQGDPDEGEPLKASADPTRLLHVFNVQANPWERAKVFRYRLIAQWLLSSKGVFIEVRRSRAGRIAMLSLLDPDMVEILPTVIGENPDGTKQIDPIGAFRVTVHDGTGPYNDLPRFDPKADFEKQPGAVLWVRSPHPTLMFRGMSPMQAAGLSADMDKAARLYNKRFMDQDGRPGGIVLVKGHANGDTLEIIEARINGGPASIGRTTAIEGDALEFVDTSGNPRDTQWSDTMDRMRKEVSIAFGCPESVLGDASGRTFDNADAEKANWLEDTVTKLADLLDDQLDVLTGSWDDALFLRHDYSKEWVLGRHKRDEIDRASEDLKQGRITLNDWLVIAGKEPIDEPYARVRFLPTGVVLAGDAEDVAVVAKLPMLGAPQAADPEVEARRGASIGSRAGVREAENVVSAQRLRLVNQAVRGGTAPRALEQRDALALTGAELEGKESGARVGGGDAAGWR
jgi:HK97 family phage portal protein